MHTSSNFLLELVVHSDHTVALVLHRYLSRLHSLSAIGVLLLAPVFFTLELNFDLDVLVRAYRQI